MNRGRWVFGLLIPLLSCDRVVNDARLMQAVTIRVSLTSTGEEAIASLGTYTVPGISRNGRYVAFISTAVNLDPADTDSTEHVFFRDIEAGTTTLVSRWDGVSGLKAGSESFDLSISADGRYVAFSTAAQLVGDDDDGATGVYVRDVQTGRTRLVSRTQGGVRAKGKEPSLSGDGRYVAFTSEDALISGDDTVSDIYVADVFNAFNDVVTLSLITADVVGACSEPSISEDGSSVAYSFGPSPEQINLRRNWNGASPSTVFISQSPIGSPGGAASLRPSVSQDGRWVAFASNAVNLVSGDNNGKQDVFVRDVATSTTTLASLNDRGVQAGADCLLNRGTAISSDGRFVVLNTSAGNLVADDSNGVIDVFVRDLTSKTVRRVSVATYGDQANGAGSHSGAISPDGTYVVFYSFGSNLVERDTNGQPDFFRRGPLR